MLQVLNLACGARNGHERVLDVFNFLRVKIKEKVRFHAVSQMLAVERSRTDLMVSKYEIKAKFSLIFETVRLF